MSNTLSIAAVLAVLESRLTTLLNDNGMAGFSVTVDHPRTDDPDPGVYLKAYHVQPNTALRNSDLPTRRADGTALRRPRMAINLSLLISFVGEDATLDAERLAGLVLTDLHARPVLTPTEINDFITGLGGGHVLAEANIGDQLERVKITPMSLDVEQLSRVWGMFNQSSYSLSVAFEVSVILLDSEVETSTARPVLTVGGAVLPSLGPQLTGVVSSAVEQPIVAIGESLVVRGHGLIGESTWVQIGIGAFEVPLGSGSTEEITLLLSGAMGLLAGVHPVRVLHRLPIGSPPNPDRVVATSNALAFALIPTVSMDQPAAIPVAGALNVRVDITPTPSPDQAVELLLDRLDGAGHHQTTAHALDGSTSVFTLSTAVPGEYLVRVSIDGAVSLPQTDLNGVFATPAVVVNP